MLKKVMQFWWVVLVAFAAVVIETGKPIGSVALTKTVLLLMAVGGLAWHWWKMRMGLASNNWPKTRGTVLASDMDFVEDGDNRERGYEVSAEYTYKVGLQLFKSTRLTFDATSHLTLAEAQRLLSIVQNSREIDVYFNPAEHSQAVLVTGASARSKWWFVLWVVLFVGAIVFAVYWRPA